MRSRVVFIMLLALALLAADTVSAATPVHQVSGGGTLVLEGGTSESYGFVAQVDGDGIVRGQGSVRLSGVGAFHFEANCLAVDGNTAWLGGVITKSSDPSVPVGLDFTWQLQDNGEGAGAALDEQSWIYPTGLLPGLGLGTDCNDKGDLFSLGILEWPMGNLQVK